MDAELLSLARSGATTLVGLMVSDGWAAVRQRIARLLARNGDVAAAETELERSREEVATARAAEDAEAEAESVEEWTPRLRRLFRNDPDAGRRLMALLEEVCGGAGAEPGGSVHNSVSGGIHYGSVVQGRDISGGITFNNGPAPAPEDRR